MRALGVIGPIFLLTATTFLSAQTTRNVPAQFATIQGAINASVHGDTVVVAPGTYGSINFTGKNITVTSSGGASSTIIAGNLSQRVVTIASNESAAVLNGFRITGGLGGILIQNASATISNCLVTGNVALNPSTGNGTGGGLYALYTGSSSYAPTIDSCTFTGNVAGSNGGGLSFETQNTSTLLATITNCTIANNTTFGGSSSSLAGGGGVNTLRSGGTLSITMDRCTVSNNTGAIAGGGLLFDNTSTANVTNCRITDNHVSGTQGYSAGAGVFVYGNLATFSNCLIARNQATYQSGGVHCGSTTGSFINCTIVDNVAPLGGGLYVPATATTSLKNTIVWGNGGAQIQQGPGTTGPIISYCTIEGGLYSSVPTNSTADPLFVDRANGDYHLSAQSPCVDSGDSSIGGITATDLDGLPRVVGPTIDRGADEAPIATLPGTNEDLDLYADVDGLGDPLASTTTALATSNLNVLLRSPAGTFVGSQPLIAGELFTTGVPPIGLVAIPQIHLDAVGSFVIYGVPGAGPFTAPGLPSSGVALTFLVPPGLSGLSLRLQGFGVTPIAVNGVFAVTSARDIVF